MHRWQRNQVPVALLLLAAVGCGTSGRGTAPAPPAHGLPARPESRSFLNMPADEDGPMPALLSQTGAFTDTRALTPAAALIPYEVNVPFWSGGASKTRW